jgi:hypothetical protein
VERHSKTAIFECADTVILLMISSQIRCFESLSETVEQAVSQSHACIRSIAVVSSDLGSAAETACEAGARPWLISLIDRP